MSYRLNLRGLEDGYTSAELEQLEKLGTFLSRVPEEQRPHVGRAALAKLWPDTIERIEKTHVIRFKEPGQVGLMKLNYAQRRLVDDTILPCAADKRPLRVIILKARQLGFSTFIQSYHYELCYEHANRYALTLSYDNDSSNELFRKAKYVHDGMWFPWPTKRDSTRALELTNGSSFFVRTSGNLSAGRGDTYHHFHGSEIPMWENAEETLVSALQAVPDKPQTSVFYESTAKGAVGQFYDDWGAAEDGRSDFIPFFAPWFWDPEYILEFGSDESRQHFDLALDPVERRLRATHNLTLEQLHWRRWTIRNKCQGSEAKFRQEYPSTPKEAFLTTGSPVFDADRVAALENNCTRPLWQGNIALLL